MALNCHTHERFTHMYTYQTMAFNQYATMDYIIQCQKLAFIFQVRAELLFTAVKEKYGKILLFRLDVLLRRPKKSVEQNHV